MNSWNVALIHNIFSLNDAENILSMPLCFINTPDKIMWKLSQDGAFSLRSSNFCIMENFLDNNHLCESGNWVAIWNLNILAKLKDFIWRITIIYKGCSMSNYTPSL